jgi:hypothetical protein
MTDNEPYQRLRSTGVHWLAAGPGKGYRLTAVHRLGLTLEVACIGLPSLSSRCTLLLVGRADQNTATRFARAVGSGRLGNQILTQQRR